jgi:peptide/nickel transport system permease protein
LTSLWRLFFRRLLLLAVSLIVFVYAIAAIADQRFMAMERGDIQYAAQISAVWAVRSANPPLTTEEAIRLQDAYQAEAAHRYGFDRPFIVRVHLRVVRLVTQGLGEMRTLQSFRVLVATSKRGWPQYSYRVADMIAHAAFPTAALFVGAFLAQVALAFFTGLWSACRPGSLLDRGTSVAGFLGASVSPVAAAGTVVTLFVYAWRVFPGDIWMNRPPGSLAGFLPWLGNFLAHYSLPFLTIVVLGFGAWAIQFRSTVLAAFGEDFVASARGRGLSERRVVYGHVARSASPPLVTTIVMGLAASMSACLFVEPMFHWPGLGLLFWKALNANADKLVFGIMLLIGVVQILASAFLEMIYGFLDPRLRTGSAR